MNADNEHLFFLVWAFMFKKFIELKYSGNCKLQDTCNVWIVIL